MAWPPDLAHCGGSPKSIIGKSPLLQPIWNHPAQGNGQKQAKKGSFGPKVPLLVALEVLGGHGGPDLVTTVTGCSACVGLMVITHFGLILGLFCMVWYVIWFYCMVLRWILFHSIALQCIAWHFIVLYHMALYCIVFDIIAVYCMSPHYILWYGMVLYFIWSYCTVSHCYVPLLQRAGELPRSASSHFYLIFINISNYSQRNLDSLIQAPNMTFSNIGPLRYLFKYVH